MIRITGTPPEADRPAYFVDLAQGQYLLVSQDIVDGSPDPGARTTYAYGVSPGALPAPAPGTTATVEAVVFEFGELTPETQVHSFGPSYDLAVGGCSYTAFDVETTYSTEPGTADGFIYLPDLGFSYLSSWTGPEGTDVYAVTRIFTP